MRILIYGAGAVGCYLGGHLALAGHEVTLLGRERLANAITHSGLILRFEDGREHNIPTIRATTTLEEALTGEAYDWIAFTMKAHDTVEAIHQLQSWTATPPPIVSFQNGVGNEDSLISAFGADQVVAGTLTTPVSMDGNHIVIEERQRGAAISGDSASSSLVADAFKQTSLRFEIIPRAADLKWSKLLLNMLANATCAILDMPPGDVMKIPGVFRLEIAALHEALAIMDLKKTEVVNLPGAPAKLLARAVRWLPPGLLQPLLFRQVAGGRGDKLPSLLVTLRSERRETEAPWLNGAVTQAASAIHRLTPVNHGLALLVTDIASGRVHWDMYRHKPEMLIKAMNIAEGMPR